MRQIVILGNGVAGITAARHLRKRCDDEILVISGESDHFFSRTALMYIYMGHMAYENTKPYEDHFWKENRIRLLRTWIQAIDTAQRQLLDADGRQIPYDVLILATGSKPNKFGWPGQDLDGVQGLYSLQDLENMERYTRGIERGVVVGGGLIGIEMSEMMHSRDIPVSFLVREKSWMERVFPAEESEMINQEIRDNGIDLRLGTELDRIEGDEHGRAKAAVTKDGSTIPCQFLGLTVGVSPNIEFVRSSGVECDRGILVDDSLETSVPGVYAIGDCAQIRDPLPGRRPVEPLWYTGRMMGETVARVLTGEDLSYDPGTWFNSAKFFDLEWQVYGKVPSQPDEGEGTLVWKDPGGKKLIRLNYLDEGERPVIGYQVMGIRYRHDVCQEWLDARKPLRYVLENLGVVNFDPEFYRQHEADLVEVYNRQFPGESLKLKRKRGLRNLFRLRRSERAA
ncbi:MAG: FAD-dependent oxidoreductase [Acidobacteriota bacterium]